LLLGQIVSLRFPDEDRSEDATQTDSLRNLNRRAAAMAIS
jgi:hypothetical protein